MGPGHKGCKGVYWGGCLLLFDSGNDMGGLKIAVIECFMLLALTLVFCQNGVHNGFMLHLS